MISFESFKNENDIPIYMQIVRHIKRGIISKQVLSGDELPSRRVLSAELGVNPNTVQKAYAILEEEGLIESHTGAKSYMSFSHMRAEEVKKELLENDAKAIVNSLKQMGFSKEDSLAIIDKFWN
ncbi:MAG: GntR family transcriptional regulator [Ruminococcaceae bacterium]|nr:GntR family transcriptional regulator [Oscillospiraceae bacterium]